MKQLRRWLFGFIAAASVVLSVAEVPLCVRSYWVRDQFFYSHYYNSPRTLIQAAWTVEIGTGAFRIDDAREDGPLGPGFGLPAPSFSWKQLPAPNPYPGKITSIWNRMGMWEYHNRIQMADGAIITYRRIIVPLWLPFLMTLICPGMWLLRCRRMQCEGPGYCPKCGYDLRATPDRCPECGTIPGAANEATI